jgi:hypothetical protein
VKADACAESFHNIQGIGYIHASSRIFVDRFVIQDALLSSNRDYWYYFIEKLSHVDFNAEAPRVELSFRIQNTEDSQKIILTRPKKYQISQNIIEGWRKVGLLGADGRWNLDITPSEIARNFRRASGMNTETFPFAVPGFMLLKSGEEFGKSLYDGLIQMGDIHDYLMHLPLLASSEDTQQFVRLLGATTWIVGDHEHGPLNSFIEDGSPNQTGIINGPSSPALVRSEGFKNKPSYPDITAYLADVRKNLGNLTWKNLDIHAPNMTFATYEDNRLAYLVQSAIDLKLWKQNVTRPRSSTLRQVKKIAWNIRKLYVFEKVNADILDLLNQTGHPAHETEDFQAILQYLLH